MIYLYFIHLILVLSCIQACLKDQAELHISLTGNKSVSGITVSENVYKFPVILQDTGLYILLDLKSFGLPIRTFDCLGIIYISTSNDLIHHDMSNDTLGIYNAGRRYGTVIVDIYTYWNQPLEDITVVYDTSGKDTASSFILSLHGVHVLATCTTGGTYGVISTLLHAISSSDTRNFVIIAPSDVIYETLQQARLMNLLITSNRWFVINTEDELLQYIPEFSLPNVLILQDNQTRFIQNLIESIFEIETQDNIYLRSNSSSCCEQPVCLRQKQMLREEIRNITNMELISADNVITLSRYNSHKGILKEVGSWTIQNGLQVHSDGFKDNKLQPILRVVTLPENPFVVKENTSTGTDYTGMMFEILEHVSKAAGFSFQTQDCSGGVYGAYDETTGTWSGCIADVESGKADLIVGPMTATSERQTVVDFPLPYLGYSGLQMIQKINKKPIFFFGEVMSLSSWLCLISLVIITSVLITFYEKFMPSSKKIGDDTHHSFGIKESIWISISSIAFASSWTIPERYGSRLLISGYWLSCAIIMAAFTANMTAFLTVSRLDDSVGDIGHLATTTNINYTVIAGSATMSYFKNMDAIEKKFDKIWERMNFNDDSEIRKMPIWDYPLDQKYKVIWTRMQNTGFITSSSETFDKIVNDNIVVITDSSFVRNFVQMNCNLETPSKPFSSRPYGYAFRKRSRFMEPFSKSLLDLQEEKILEKLKSKWWNKDIAVCYMDKGDQGLSLYEMVYSFIVAVSGIGVGLLALMCEILIEKLSKISKKYGVNDTTRITD